MPQTFHKRRPVYEAVQYLPGTNCSEVAEFIGAPVHAPGECDSTAVLEIPPWGGTTTASPGDWLIRGDGGSLAICPAELFGLSYEPT
ncbi:hypothetical protein [Dietzia sp. PP-33]|uniref:hypothetical protein n=1 Tax=Dietzia sp. PP-33 TaxID=2957500 RepID=UPI0029A7B23A|nr:hypothetical protein [Dietzia sp. PP-33]MDX2357450.1 hypothetical protein [Dietzia sp. PP-33]